MKLAMIGYGAMGKLVHKLSEERGHEVVAVIDEAASSLSDLAEKLKPADVAIDFSTAEAVRRNVESCLLARVALVEGTTGWNAELTSIEEMVRREGGSMVYGANFSIGVNLFYRIADHAAELLAKFPEYETFIEEQHHSRKKDAPSGTALKLRDVVAKHFPNEFSIAATRAGNIPGTHRVGFDGPADQILLQHTARSREGFAGGSIMAAEWLVGKTGFYEFSDVIDEICQKRER
jgi:4-hydroxy-tetrahydrodipicolinate reductase